MHKFLYECQTDLFTSTIPSYYSLCLNHQMVDLYSTVS